MVYEVTLTYSSKGATNLKDTPVQTMKQVRMVSAEDVEELSTKLAEYPSFIYIRDVAMRLVDIDIEERVY